MKALLTHKADGGRAPSNGQLSIGNWQLVMMFFLAAFFLLSACDDAFVPVTEHPSDFFALYGFLDSNADTQFVRVSPVRPLLNPASRPTDVRVFSTRVDAGERRAWRDSLVVLDDGTTGLLFYAPFRAERGATYLLEVQDAAENVTEALTAVPPALAVRVDSLAQPFEFIQHVTWLNQQQQPTRTALRYTVALSPSSPPIEITLPVSDQGRPTAAGWTFAINLSRDRTALLGQLNRPATDSSVILFDLEMEIEQRSEEWLNPNTPFNIQNGFGFFGAVSTSTDTWMLEADALEQVGYATPPARAP